MLFKDLKQGYTLYVFDRTNVTINTVKIVSVTPPHIDTHYGNISEMVVDITTEEGDNNRTYTFKDSSEVGYSGTFVISPNRDNILRELEVMKSSSEEALKQVDKHRETVSKCSELLVDFNPQYKEKKETEERFSRMEESMRKMQQMMQQMSAIVSSQNNNINQMQNV